MLLLDFKGEILANYKYDTELKTCDISPDGRYIVAVDNLKRLHFLELL